MKEIKIYGWSDLKKWFWDRFCFPRWKLVAECLDYYGDEASSLFEKLFPVMCAGVGYKTCIPYNDDTKHLISTKYDCPEYYKWWRSRI